MLQLRTVNKALKKLDPLLELERGEGYFYFIYDDGDGLYETKSEHVYRLNDLSLEQWVDWGSYVLNTQIAKVKQDREYRTAGTVPGYCNPQFRLKGD